MPCLSTANLLRPATPASQHSPAPHNPFTACTAPTSFNSACDHCALPLSIFPAARLAALPVPFYKRCAACASSGVLCQAPAERPPPRKSEVKWVPQITCFAPARKKPYDRPWAPHPPHRPNRHRPSKNLPLEARRHLVHHPGPSLFLVLLSRVLPRERRSRHIPNRSLPLPLHPPLPPRSRRPWLCPGSLCHPSIRWPWRPSSAPARPWRRPRYP